MAEKLKVQMYAHVKWVNPELSGNYPDGTDLVETNELLATGTVQGVGAEVIYTQTAKFDPLMASKYGQLCVITELAPYCDVEGGDGICNTCRYFCACAGARITLK